MNTSELNRTLKTLFCELVEGAPSSGASILNPGDSGLLRSLDRLSAGAASEHRSDGTSVAAHIEHVRYGLSLLNRWVAGENPFEDANWSASWEKDVVSDEEWIDLRRDLRIETERWSETLGTPREMNEIELNGVIGSIAHLAYHMGAIRQINRDLRGPAAND